MIGSDNWSSKVSKYSNHKVISKIGISQSESFKKSSDVSFGVSSRLNFVFVLILFLLCVLTSESLVENIHYAIYIFFYGNISLNN